MIQVSFASLYDHFFDMLILAWNNAKKKELPKNVQMKKSHPGLLVWGGENFELSFKIWQCGGSIGELHCNTVQYLFHCSKIPSLGALFKSGPCLSSFYAVQFW